MKHFHKLSLIIVFFLTVNCTISSPYKVNDDPSIALKKFYDFDSYEESLMDPLIVAGKDVVPLVIEEVKNKNMPKRRYAIGFLGNCQCVESLNTLKSILQDLSERDIYRGDALLSIYMIDNKVGKEYAQEYEYNKDFVGEIAKDILKDEPYINERRSYIQALTSTKLQKIN